MRTQISIALLLACAATATPVLAAVQISANPTQNMNCAAGVCSPTAKEAVLNTTDLSSMLASGDVEVKAGASAVTIGVTSPLSWASINRLTLSAECNINMRSQITVTGGGALTLRHIPSSGPSCPPDGVAKYHIRFFDGGVFFQGGRIVFWDVGSNLIINGQNYTLFKSISDFKKLIKSDPGGYFALADNYDAVENPYGASPIHKFEGTLEGLGNSISNLTINAHSKYVGLIGYSYALVRNLSLVNANVSGDQNSQNVGALAGFSEYVVLNCASNGNVSGSNASVGGLIGFAYTDRVMRSHSDATVNGLYAGGLIGAATGGSIVSEDFATGTISGSADAGGLIGINGNFTLTDDSYATGSVNGDTNAGGLTGYESASQTYRSYAIGAVQSPKNVGGVFGDIGSESAGDDYWDVDTSGTNQGCGEEYFAECSQLVGLSDSQLKAGLPHDFDPAIWGQSASINNGYPYLIDNPPPN